MKMKIALIITLISTIISIVDFDLEQVRNDLVERHNYYRAAKVRSPSKHTRPIPNKAISHASLSNPTNGLLQNSEPPEIPHKHKRKKLRRSRALETIAQSHSEKLASLGYLVHSSNTLNGNHIGENIYIWNKGGYLGTKPVDDWYSEIKDYDFAKSEFSQKTSHFTQLVWENTEQVGCGVACDKKDFCYVTCNYYPAGNYLGQFKTNVLPFNDSTPEDITTTKEKNANDAPTPETSNDSELEKFKKNVLDR